MQTRPSTRRERFLARLFRQNEFAIKLGLDAMARALARCGQPHARCPHVLVAGTNGKGSVASLLATLATVAAGARTGLFTSPHLVDFAERIRVDGRRLDDTVLLELGPAVLATFGGSDPNDDADAPSSLVLEPDTEPAPVLTYFELATLLAALAFARADCALAVYEVGLGGRLDATNALDPALSVITAIGLDHCELLGDTLEAIAAEKAAVVRRGRPAILASRAVPDTLRALCRARGAYPILELGRDFDLELDAGAGTARFRGPRRSLELDAASVAAMPQWRRDNVAAALAAACELEALGALSLSPDDALLREAVARWRWPGRLWAVPPERVEALCGRRDVELVLDAAHNPAGARALAEVLAAQPSRRVHLVTNSLRDKDPAAVLAALRPHCDAITVVPIFSNRALEPAVYCARTGLAAEAHVVGSLREGLLTALRACPPGAMVLVTGSIYLLGEVIALTGCEPLLENLIAPASATEYPNMSDTTDTIQADPQQPVAFDGDIQVAKRELIKLGLKQGRLSRTQIAAHLPLEHMSEVEIEVLTFTFESLGIEVESA